MNVQEQNQPAGPPELRDTVDMLEVRAWRVDRFGAIVAPHTVGPDPDLYIALLADARGDDGFPVCLHRFERLIAAGCDPDIAAHLLDATSPAGAWS